MKKAEEILDQIIQKEHGMDVVHYSDSDFQMYRDECLKAMRSFTEQAVKFTLEKVVNEIKIGVDFQMGTAGFNKIDILNLLPEIMNEINNLTPPNHG